MDFAMSALFDIHLHAVHDRALSAMSSEPTWERFAVVVAQPPGKTHQPPAAGAWVGLPDEVFHSFSSTFAQAELDRLVQAMRMLPDCWRTGCIAIVRGIRAGDGVTTDCVVQPRAMTVQAMGKIDAGEWLLYGDLNAS